MGDIWQADKLTLFLAFFMPGFVASQVYRLFIPCDVVDFTKELPAIVAYSSIHYALTGWILFVVPEGTARLIATYVVVLVLPLFWAPLVLLIRDWERWAPKILTKNLLRSLLKPEQRPWDAVFDLRDSFVRVRLKSGAYVGGFYTTGSAISTFPNEPELYISQSWILDKDGVFKEPAQAPTGLLVRGSEIEFLELVDWRKPRERPTI